MERILFYLPTVTPWWFDNIVVHLIEKLSHAAEVHVFVPPLWRNTGVGPEQLEGCASITGVHWHIPQGEGHRALRTAPDDPDEVVEFARAIDPTWTLCRSADIETPSRFPGKVRHLMEAGVSQLSTRADWLILQPDFFHHGAMPNLTDEDRAAIDNLFAGTWARMRDAVERENAFALPRAEALRSLGLPADRKIIAVPLEYEHEEAFTQANNRFERNLDLIHYLAGHLDENYLLAVSDHPLNCKYVDNSDVHEAIAALGDRARLIPNPEARGFATSLLVKHCDGLILQNTKSIYSGAFFGKPTLRLSTRPTADWLGVHDDLDAFQAAVRAGEAGTTEEQTRIWFGYHVLHEIIDPAVTSGAEILDRLHRPFSRDRLMTGLGQIEAYHRELDLAA